HGEGIVQVVFNRVRSCRSSGRLALVSSESTTRKRHSQQPPFSPGRTKFKPHAVDGRGVVQLLVAKLHLHSMPLAENADANGDGVAKTPIVPPLADTPHEVRVQCRLHNLPSQDVVHVQAQYVFRLAITRLP